MREEVPAGFALHFVGIGPQRTGSTWLDAVLREHPQVCLPHAVKETMFFDQRMDRGVAWYASHFRPDDGKLTGEIAPTYFDAPGVPDAIHRFAPRARVIATLRHPAARAESLWRHHVKKGRAPRDFAAACARIPNIVTAGHYQAHLTAWLDVFPADAVLVLIQEDIAADPSAVAARVMAFLGVDVVPLAAIHQRVNEASAPRFPRLARQLARGAEWLRGRRAHGLAEFGKRIGLKRAFRGGQLPSLTSLDKRRLTALYEADIAFVERLLGRSLAAWRDVGE
jgi:hypothetical protein